MTAVSLKEAIDSPRAVSALKKVGITTVEDLSGHALEDLAKIKGIGQRTLEQIQAVVVTEPQHDFLAPTEESDADLHLLSPRQSYVIWVLRGERVNDPVSGVNRVHPPVLIQFVKGRGTISRETYLKRRYQRNPLKIQEHIDAGKPWRVECSEWLKSRQKHGVEYKIMTD